MDRTVLTVRELAKRWGCAEQTIREMDMDGRLHRVKLPGVRFSIREVEQLETVGLQEQALTPYQKQMKDMEISRLKAEVEKYRQLFWDIQQRMAASIVSDKGA